MKHSTPREGPGYFLLGMVLLSVVVVDQLTKLLIQQTMNLHQSIAVLDGFFAITYIRNPGAAFGILADLSPDFRFYFFTLVSLAALVFLTVFYSRTPREDLWTRVGLAMVGGGALGNLIDRLRLGEVIDFLDFSIGAYHWPAFNVADSAISIGLGFLILQLVLRSRAESQERPTHPVP